MVNNKILFSCLLLLSCANAKIEIIHPYMGSIQKSFVEPAQTRLENIYAMDMPLSGELERINLREGSKVLKGEIVAQLVQEPLLLAVKSAKEQLNTFKAAYAMQEKIAQRRVVLGKDFVGQEEIDKESSYVEMLAAQIASNQANLATAEYNLKISTMRSPINGVVLNRYTQGGKWVTVGQPLLRIGDLKELEVICEVLSQEAQQLKLGDTVLLSSIGSPVVLRGKVKRIYPAGFTKRSSLGVDEQRVNVIISIVDSESANLGVGYRLQAEFLVGDEQKNTLLVPRFSVLQDNQGRFYVFQVKNKKLHKQIVIIGITTDSEISIKSGLTVSDVIVAQPTADMYDGMKI